MSEAKQELAEVDSPENMKRFFDAVKERAQGLPASCIENTHVDVAAKGLWMLAQGKSYKEIRDVTGMGHDTIRRLDWDHRATLDDYRPMFAKRYAMAAAEMTDLIFKKAHQLHDDEEELSKTPIDRLAVAAGILQDHSNRMAGMATAVVEHRKGVSIEDAYKEIQLAKARLASKNVIEAEIIEDETHETT